MSVVLTDIDVGKKEISLGEFILYLFENKEGIEDKLFGNILQKSENDANIDENIVLDFLDKNTKGK